MPTDNGPSNTPPTRNDPGRGAGSLDDRVRRGAGSFDFSTLIEGISKDEPAPGGAEPRYSWGGPASPGRPVEPPARRGGGAAVLIALVVLALIVVGAGGWYLFSKSRGAGPAGAPDALSSVDRSRDKRTYEPADARTLGMYMSHMSAPLKAEWRNNGGTPQNTVAAIGGDTHLALFYLSPGGIVRRIWQTWPKREWAPAWETVGEVPGGQSIMVGLLKSTNGLEIRVEDAKGKVWRVREVEPNTASAHWGEWTTGD